MIFYDGKADIGYNRENQEDAISVTELDSTTSLYIVCDGSGMQPSGLNPAEIACNEISSMIKRQFEYDKDFLIDNIEPILIEAMNEANRVLGVFRIIDEERYAGFGTSATACLLYSDSEDAKTIEFTFAHAGNTRLNLIRQRKKDDFVIMQLTDDHTKAYELYLEGKIDSNQYHTHPDRLKMTSGLGVFADPTIQIYTSKIKENDILVMTSDGIHYAITQKAIMDLILASKNTIESVNNLITGAKSQEYEDNMSAIILYNVPKDQIHPIARIPPVTQDKTQPTGEIQTYSHP